MHTADLRFDGLPDLPQVTGLRRYAALLWQRDDVLALWMGGSLAAGGGDHFSDLDLRAAIAPDRFDGWRAQRPWLALFDPSCVGTVDEPYGTDATHHFALLANGDMFDLIFCRGVPVQAEHEIVVLACRDDALARRLRECVVPRPDIYAPATAAGIERLIVDFWLNSHKHRKVLGRGLELLVHMGLAFDRERVVRLWHAAITGTDIGDARPSIHSWGRMMRAVGRSMGPRALQVLGAPVTSRALLFAHVEQLRREVSDVGRQLATRLTFAYPDALERTVLDSWKEFLATDLEHATTL